MVCRACVVLLAAIPLAFAGILDDVRSALEKNNLAGAENEMRGYRARHGIDPEYLEALSWMARASLAQKQLDRAGQFAKETESLSRQQLARRSLDSEPHLPIALGAALEVEAQVLAARGQQAEAVAVLRRGLASYANTSIRARLQKNLNLLGLTGQPAPPSGRTPGPRLGGCAGGRRRDELTNRLLSGASQDRHPKRFCDAPSNGSSARRPAPRCRQ